MAIEPDADMKSLFDYGHLPKGPIREKSIEFANFVQQYLDEAISPRIATKVQWLLWEAKNLAVWDEAKNGELS